MYRILDMESAKLLYKPIISQSDPIWSCYQSLPIDSNIAIEELGGGVTSHTPRKLSILAFFLHLILMTGLGRGGWVGRCERTKPMQVITATSQAPPNTCHFPRRGNADWMG